MNFFVNCCIHINDFVYNLHWFLLVVFPFTDACGVQICSHPEEGTQGQTGHDAALCSQTPQDPDQVSGAPVEKE